MPESIAGVSTLPDGGKVFGLRMIRELPEDLVRVTFGHRPSITIISSLDGVWDNGQMLRQADVDEVQTDDERPEILALALAFADEGRRLLREQGIEAEYQEHHLLIPFPPFGVADQDERGWTVRPSEERIAMLRGITGPGDPALNALIRPAAPPQERLAAYDHLQEQIRLLGYFEWVENRSPFEDDHWRLIRYGGIGVHLKGVIPADRVPTIF